MEEYWGGLLVVLIFGGNYQLIPVKADGAIQGYTKTQDSKASKNDFNERSVRFLVNEGSRLFIEDMTENVFVLDCNYRVKDEEFCNILLKAQTGYCTDADAEWIMGVILFNHQTDTEWMEKIENGDKTMWLCTTKKKNIAKNMTKLTELSKKKKVPMARLHVHWISNKIQCRGKSTINKTHFNLGNIVQTTDICVGMIVAIKGINHMLEFRLFNGARGEVVDIIYDSWVPTIRRKNTSLSMLWSTSPISNSCPTSLPGTRSTQR